MTVPLRVIIVDDEELARERLRQLCARHEALEVVAECIDGDQALSTIASARPDLAFLDIRMPGRDGVAVAEALMEDADAPAIVFVTAHDEFALRAFEVSAIDYLVKPVDRERFDQMLERVQRRGNVPRGASMEDDALRTLLRELRMSASTTHRFVVRDARGHYFVRADDIETATAEGNYVALGDGRRTHLVRETMRSFETKVDAARFLRIHRSTIVNIDRIARIEPMGHGEYTVIMRSGARFESSRAYNERLRALLR